MYKLTSRPRPHIGGFIRGDAALVATALVAELDALAATPSGWRTSIGELLPEDRVVVSDGGHFLGWANMYWPVASPDGLIMIGTAFQAIGQGFPSVAGAALGKPDCKVSSLVVAPYQQEIIRVNS